MKNLLLKKRRCPNCGKELKENWNFCPFCGEEVGRLGIGVRRREERELRSFEDFGLSLFPSFRSLFEEIDKEFRRLDKIFKSGFDEIEEFRDMPIVRGGGVSIVIRDTGKGKPEISVRTSGDFKKLEPEIKARLGVSEGVREVGEEEMKVEERPRKIPSVTEEPEAKIERKRDYLKIEIELPDVKSEKDIEIRKLEQSIEIRAFAEDKAYFKLIPIPPDFEILEKNFENHKLTLVLGR
ncbi:hypothetical protein DRN63_04265 [Nanoarchaeota archaeon]|nr:MAG: hypothetical protein DRN63_04265 [Nanoarchaeota archaeon]